MLDLGFPLAALKGIGLLCRTAGLIGHLTEEAERPIGFIMSGAAAAAIEYDGAASSISCYLRQGDTFQEETLNSHDT
jgi:hypothetical protein